MKNVPVNVKLRKGEQHHWWPRSLSRYWADKEGLVNRLCADGTPPLRQEPHKFGSIANAHHVELNGPWTHTYEPMFNTADAAFPHLVEEILQLDSVHDAPATAGEERYCKAMLSAEMSRLLPACIASLIVRSPRFRHSIKKSVNDFGAYTGGVSERHEIIAMNIGNCFSSAIKSIENCGLSFFLFSDHDEFVFGDGFLHNITSSANTHDRVRILLPLLPEVALVLISPSGPYQSGQRTIRATRKEVATINYITQVYSGKYIFFRSQLPELYDCFTIGEFRQFEYHKHPFLNRLMEPFIWNRRFSWASPKIV